MADNRLNTFLPNRSVMGAKMLQRPADPYLRQQAPEVYGALSGLMGTAPDQQGSVLDPNTARARAGAEIGFPLGTALQMLPFFGPAKTGAMVVGRAGERLAERAVPQIMERGGMGAEMLQGMSRGTVSPMDVYHGSPYKFDRFNASKIGSGEGAQVYGHGLYFAEVPEVAKGYQTALAGKDGTATGHAAQVVNVYGGDYEKALKHLKSIQPAPGETTFSGESHELIRDAIKAIQSGAYKSADKGSFYKVDLPDAQIAKMLDWDKPLSEQSKEVQAAMDRAFQLHLGRTPQVNKDTFTGAQAYEMLTGGTSGMQGYENIAAQGSKALRQAGIPGIKYLDQQSRNAGGWHLTSPDNTVRGKWMLKSSDYNSNGVFFDTQQEAQSALKEKLGKETRNFVTFPGEEKSLTILERNGQPSRNSLNSFIR
jgi:hypothetical protein